MNVTDTIDLGNGFRLVPIHEYDKPDVTSGFIDEHPSADPKSETGRCSGAIWIVGDGTQRPVWTVEQESPLTLSPSLFCRICGNHGWVREGKWVPA